MAEFLFPNFLTADAQYEMAEALWLNKWQELARRTGRPHQWRSPWLATSFVGGATFRDGDPIFSAINSTRRLGIRVNQFEPGGRNEEISYWVGKFAKGEPEEISELVISCSLTTYTLSVALDLMYRWMIKASIRLENESFDSPFSQDVVNLTCTSWPRVA